MRIGIIGAGQLGQMLGSAARELGDACQFLDLVVIISNLSLKILKQFP